MLIVMLDEIVDLAFEVGHGVKGATADGALSNQAEPTFYLVEPRGRSECRGHESAVALTAEVFFAVPYGVCSRFEHLCTLIYRENIERNSRSDSRSPSAVNKTDLALLTGSSM